MIVWNDVVRLAEDWYFSQCAATDPKARRVPLSDEMVGTLLKYIVSHEIGHTLGLEHNFKGSIAYTIPQLRDPAFTAAHGVAASIMSYSRFNYVAQPGDGVTRTWGMIGPYDIFAIQYGYTPIANAASPDNEKPWLDNLLSKQVANPWLRFGNYLYSGVDPTTQMENISNDPVEAGRLGLLNLDRIAKNYLVSSTTKYGEDYKILDEMQGKLLNQRFTELFHIVPRIGGVIETDYHAGRGREVFDPVSSADKARAAEFLTTRGFETPKALFDPHIMEYIAPTGIVESATSLTAQLMNSLLGESRMHRLQDAEALQGSAAFSISKLFADVTNGAWAELDAPSPKIDVYRRTVQRGFLQTVDSRINGSFSTKTDLKPIARTDLKLLAKRIDKALARTTDKVTSEHLNQSRHDIELILEGKYSSDSAGGFGGFEMFGITKNRISECWDMGATIREAITEASK